MTVEMKCLAFFCYCCFLSFFISHRFRCRLCCCCFWCWHSKGARRRNPQPSMDVFASRKLRLTHKSPNTFVRHLFRHWKRKRMHVMYFSRHLSAMYCGGVLTQYVCMLSWTKFECWTTFTRSLIVLMPWTSEQGGGRLIERTGVCLCAVCDDAYSK